MHPQWLCSRNSVGRQPVNLGVFDGASKGNQEKSDSKQTLNRLNCFFVFLNGCNVFYFFPLLLSDGAFQNHSRLRTPPLPLSHSHSHSPNHQHHAASINSLNRGNYTPRSNPSPAPTDSSVPPEGPASGQDSGSAQDNWLLNSNIPLETRYHVTCLPDGVWRCWQL